LQWKEADKHSSPGLSSIIYLPISFNINSNIFTDFKIGDCDL